MAKNTIIVNIKYRFFVGKVRVHKFTWKRVMHLWFWKGQIFCRLFGHRVNANPSWHWCERCGLAYEEIHFNYGETPAP